MRSPEAGTASWLTSDIVALPSTMVVWCSCVIVDTGEAAAVMDTSASDVFRTTPNAADIPESAAFTQASLTLSGQAAELLALGEAEALAEPEEVVVAEGAGRASPPSALVEPDEQPASIVAVAVAARIMVARGFSHRETPRQGWRQLRRRTMRARRGAGSDGDVPRWGAGRLGMRAHQSDGRAEHRRTVGRRANGER